LIDLQSQQKLRMPISDLQNNTIQMLVKKVMQDNNFQISMMRMIHLEIVRSEMNMIWEWVRNLGLDSIIRRDKDKHILNLNSLTQQTLTSLMKNSKSSFLTLRSILSR